jgi:F0F1-type ATP synthase membrane subunit b/b'
MQKYYKIKISRDLKNLAKLFDISGHMAKIREKKFLTKSKMADDFLVKVKETEQKVSEMIEKALKQKGSDLLKYKQELTKKRENNFKKDQEHMKAKLQQLKNDARKEYEEKIAEGDTELKKMKSEKINMITELFSEADKFFLEIL